MPFQTTHVRWLLIAVLAVAAIGLLGGGVAASDAATGVTTAEATQDGEDPLVASCAAEMPSDYADPAGGTSGTIGWVDGYWYDEPIDVTASDGLSEAELERLTARTSARAEALRCLTFEEVPPVEVVSREEYANTTGEQFANVSADARRFDNAMLSTMLLVGQTNDSVGVREDSRSQTVAGYYSIEDDRIVVIEQEGTGSAVDETVLVHEVGHALQDQHFDIQRPSNVTMDRDNGLLGLIEGDVSWLENQYLDRCEAGRWAQSCVTLESAGGNGTGGSGGASASAPPNWGLYLEQFQPYSDGPTFVRSIYREGGWAAVNETYADVPRSALYVISPETYGEVELVEPEITNDSRGDWERLTVPGAPADERPGPAGIGGMVIAPTYETSGARNVVSPMGILNYGPDGNVSDFDPLNYDQPPVEGWRGGRMAVFERGNGTATVWRTAWTDGEEAQEFADAYEQLLAIHDAAAVEGREGVFRFNQSSDHSGAVAIVVEGDQVRIVTAPSVDALEDVSPALRSGGGGGSGEGLPVPGFGIAVALLAAIASAGLLVRRQR
ncbi:Hvo_1808 family surface protein [Salinarchaeum sp. Harcht-Bsk1]|uniref:Hvo_1808 family surface protein n=1 Tax=Salinarchaeum sp. Harcht-Bsk1 TaxID=1333523 RepID=UPI0011819155|nr:Hvo_1808 family surface protein [Salinarchaeum sp. Harcht-Bsk1]